MARADDALARLVREEGTGVLATLIRVTGQVDLAQDAAQDAMVRALETWPRDGVPDNPRGWLLVTAKRRAVDIIRREARRAGKETEAMMFADPVPGPAEPPEVIRDDLLRLVFTCCHPALALEAQVALALRTLGGLSTAEVARSLLVPEPTMAKRLSRARQKIAQARIPYRVPDADELPGRLAGVAATVYLIFNEGYAASAGAELVRADLCTEAIRLTRELAGLMPDEPEVAGLLGLLLLVESRRPARTAPDGTLVLLPDQDRTRWNQALVAEGQALVRACLRRNRPGPYQIQAAIAAVHSDAPTAADTDWSQILALYDQLAAVVPTAVVALNRAVAVAEVHGPAAGLAEVDLLDLPTYHLHFATRADLLARLGHTDEARAAYGRALELATNEAERTFLAGRLHDLRARGTLEG
jgi:RNA polymerase sigma-70 factor (ECF subfamily)